MEHTKKKKKKQKRQEKTRSNRIKRLIKVTLTQFKSLCQKYREQHYCTIKAQYHPIGQCFPRKVCPEKFVNNLFHVYIVLIDLNNSTNGKKLV